MLIHNKQVVTNNFWVLLGLSGGWPLSCCVALECSGIQEPLNG
jgi:hypothetical protein